MTNIEMLLDELAELRSAIDVANLRMQESIDGILTPEQKTAIAEIKLEYAPMIEEATAKAAAIEENVKETVAEHGATVRAGRLQAVFTKGRVTWDAKALDGYMINEPAIAAFRSEGKPSVSIRAVK